MKNNLSKKITTKIVSGKAASGLKGQLKILFYRIRLWLVIICCVAIIFLALTSKLQTISTQIKQYFYDSTITYGYKFNNLVIANIKNATKSTIAAAVLDKPGTSIFAIDINEIKTRLEQMHWVSAAIVERRFPDTIYIAIIERQPVALWQNEYKFYLIAEQGYVIPIESTKKFNELPLLIGSDAPLHANKLIENINKYPALAKHVISATRYGERRWNLYLSKDITVKMPELDFGTALKYINSLYTQSQLFTSNYKVIDLRDHKKYYIEKHKTTE